MIGEDFSRYRIVERLGEGGMGVVYKAEDTRLKRTVAIKIPPARALAKEADKKRFFVEAQTAACLDHPNICTIYEVDEWDGHPYISMAYCEGEDLKKIVDKGPLPVERALDIAIQIAQGLGAAHDKGVVHRDVKTVNIMVSDRGHVTILDFGLARLLPAGSVVPHEREISGTACYMSPEQTRGKSVDQRADIWSFGVVAYEMLTGRLPFRGEYEDAVVYAIVNEEPDPVSALRSGAPAELERIVAKCLAKNPANRYQSASDLLANLRRLRVELDSRDFLARENALPRRKASGIRGMVLPAATVTVILALLLVAYFRNGAREAIGAQVPVAVADFVNDTGDPELDGLSGMLITSLEQSRVLSVLPRSRMLDLAELLGNPSPAKIDERIGREICRQANINVLVVASIRKFDDVYTIDVAAYDTFADEHRFAARETGKGKASIPGMIDRIAERTRRGFDETPAAIAVANRNVGEMTTTNLEAFQQYFAGEEHLGHLRFDEAAKAFEKAIEIDSTFALAHYRLAYAHWWVHEDETIQRADMAKAIALIDRLPERFRYLLRAQKAVLDDGYEAGIRELEAMKRVYPDDKEMNYNLGDFCFHAGRYDEAVTYLSRILETDPEDSRALNHLAMTYLAMKDKPKALAAARRYADITRTDEAYVTLANAHLIDGDKAGALREIRAAREAIPPTPLLDQQLAVMEMLNDDFESARAILDSLVAEGPPEHILLSAYGSLVALGLHQGRYRDALAHLERRMTLAFYAPSRADSVSAIFQHQIAGLVRSMGWNDSRRAVDEFEKAARFKEALAPSALQPENLAEYYINVGVFRAVAGPAGIEPGVTENDPGVDLRFGDRIRFFDHVERGELAEARAIADTLIARPDEKGKYAIRYFLARADIERGSYDEAISVLRDLQADVLYGGSRSLFYVPSFFLLGRAYEGKGDVPRAIESFKRFLGFWSNADGDLALLKDARTRLAALQSASVQ